MINSSLIFCDFTNLFGFFSPIFSHCNMIYFNLAVFTSYICDFCSYFTQLITFNLQDLLIFSYLPLETSIFGLIFSCFGFLTVTLPLVLFYAIPVKEMFSLTIGGDSQVANNNSNSNSNTINSILFLSYLNKKIPKWLKIFFNILFVTILVLKLYGFSIGSVFVSLFSINVFYLKLAYYILFSLIICFHLLNLYLLHKFSNKNMKILEVLPEFIIKWLKEIELMSTSKPGIKEFKTNCYMQITVYLLLMSTTIIAANLV